MIAPYIINTVRVFNGICENATKYVSIVPRKMITTCCLASIPLVCEICHPRCFRCDDFPERQEVFV